MKRNVRKIIKNTQNTLYECCFSPKATEAGASFAKKEVSFIPFKIFKKVIEKGVEKKIETGEFDAMVIFDINFQKQQVLERPSPWPDSLFSLFPSPCSPCSPVSPLSPLGPCSPCYLVHLCTSPPSSFGDLVLQLTTLLLDYLVIHLVRLILL